MRYRKLGLMVLVLQLVAGPLLAYTIYLKDGSRLIAREKFRVDQQGKAIIVLQNGTQTFIDASEIDVARTERANQGRYGTAFVIDEDGRVVEGPLSGVEKEQTLAGAAARAEPTVTTRSRATRPTTANAIGSDYPRTAAGFVDLAAIPRAPYRDLDVAVETSRFLRALGVNEFKVFQGTQPDRAFVEMVTNSEAAVFRGLEAAADTLMHLRSQYPGLIEELELLMITSNRDRAGQFLLDSAAATELADNNVDPSTFFVQNVQF